MPVCMDVREDLKAFVDGELGQGRREAVRRHLDGCSECRDEMGAVERLGVELRTLDSAAPDPSLRRRILAALPDDAPVLSAPARRPAWWSLRTPSLRLAGATAAALFLVAIYVRAGSPPPPPLESSPTALTESEATGSDGSVAEKGKSDAEPRATEERTAEKGGPGSRRQEKAPTARERKLNTEILRSIDRIARMRDTPPSAAAIPPPAAGARRDRISKSAAGATERRYGGLEEKLPAAAQTAPAGPAGQSVNGNLAARQPNRDLAADSLLALKPGPTPELSKDASFGAVITPETTALYALKAQAKQDGAQEVLMLEVEELERGTTQVRTLANKEGAYVSPPSKVGGDLLANNLTVILPEEKVDSLKARLRKYSANMITARPEVESVRHLRGGVEWSAKSDAPNQALGTELRQQLPLGRAGGFGGGGGRPGGLGGAKDDRSAQQQTLQPAPASKSQNEQVNMKRSVQLRAKGEAYGYGPGQDVNRRQQQEPNYRLNYDNKKGDKGQENTPQFYAQQVVQRDKAGNVIAQNAKSSVRLIIQLREATKPAAEAAKPESAKDGKK